jgi:hypothetical protein
VASLANCELQQQMGGLTLPSMAVLPEAGRQIARIMCRRCRWCAQLPRQHLRDCMARDYSGPSCALPAARAMQRRVSGGSAHQAAESKS